MYSFRHSGAIEIFKRTGSLTKLQKAMGHSSLNVSLTYLRGLEVAELTEQDITIYSFRHSGAIEIFKRTGSLTKLQKAMGHSSLNN